MISVLTGILGLAVSLTIIVLIRKDRLHVRHGMGWMVVAIAFALLGFSPGIIDKLAAWLGVGYPPVLALVAAVALLVLKILLIDIESAESEVRRARLIQRVAMLEAELHSLRACNPRKESPETEGSVPSELTRTPESESKSPL